MEEIEVYSWLTLDAIKKEAEIVEVVGDLQTGHCQAVFCTIEEDLMELCYSDTTSSFIRRYEDKEEFEAAMEKRKEDYGDERYDEDRDFVEDFDDMDEEESEDYEESEL